MKRALSARFFDAELRAAGFNTAYPLSPADDFAAVDRALPDRERRASVFIVPSARHALQNHIEIVARLRRRTLS